MSRALVLLVAVVLPAVRTLAYGGVVSESCTTPLGVSSSCKSIYECPEMLAAIRNTPIPDNVVNFVRLSGCGTDSKNIPKVCCGPVPSTTESFSGDSDSNGDSSVAPSNVCGIDPNGDRIFGGTTADLDEFPWMALLGYLTPRGSMTYQCGGTLINHRYVLTAAHCMVGEVNQKVGQLKTVRLGEYNTKTERDCIKDDCAEPVQELPVQSTYPHPGYDDKDSTKKDDIALVRLATRARYSDYVKPICVLGSSVPPAEGALVYVAGWGKTLSGKNSDTKQKLNMTVFNKRSCDDKYKSLGAALTQRQMCAGGKFAEDSCRGDSGGPLMAYRAEGYWQIVGVVSFGYGCGADGWPGVYTSVLSYVDWIQSTLRNTNY